VVPGSPAARSGDITGRYLGRDPASEEHYAAVRDWIVECSAHDKCNQTVSGSANINTRQSPLPTRCIEVSRSGKRTRLRRTEGQLGAYITLTHRWNRETEDCKTTTDNYAERLEGRGFGSLPRLFRDVFTVAEKLDVQYVWIDSICIIQSGDDGADWRREAVKMAQYYQFSLLTVAGTMPDTEHGFLSPNTSESPSAGDSLNPGEGDRTPWANRLVQLPYRGEAGAQAGVFYVYRRKARLVEDYWSLVRGSALFGRGWILQEWLLSTRLLWYTPRGLFFECRSDRPRTECREKIELEVAEADMRSHLQLKASFNCTDKSILDFWYNALQVYSACDLSKTDQDRVLALAGLAKEVRQILVNSKPEAEAQNEVYLSGLWLSDIHRGLLWEEHRDAQPWRSVNGVSSWSWASIMCKVRWPERSRGVQAALKVTGVCLRRRERHERPQYATEGKQGLRAFGDTTSDAIAGVFQTPPFDPTNTFSCLHVRGRLATVHVRGYLDTKEKLHKATVCTVYNLSPASYKWRAICSPARPEIIAGWGSLERLGPSADCADFGLAVRALHVSTRYLTSGLLIKRADPVFDVLFLEEIQSGVYTRLGIGRIADEYLTGEFGKLEEEAFQLI
jgi:hypothetical protein